MRRLPLPPGYWTVEVTVKVKEMHTKEVDESVVFELGRWIPGAPPGEAHALVKDVQAGLHLLCALKRVSLTRKNPKKRLRDLKKAE